MVKRKVMLVVLCGGISGLLCGVQAPALAQKLSQLDEGTKVQLEVLLSPEWSKSIVIFNSLSDAEKNQFKAEADAHNQELDKQFKAEKAEADARNQEFREEWQKRQQQEQAAGQAAEQAYKANKGAYDAVLAGLTEAGKKQEMKALLNKYAGEVAKLAGPSLKGDALRTQVREILKNLNDVLEISYKIAQEKDDTKKDKLREQLNNAAQKSRNWYGFVRALNERGEDAEIDVVYAGLLKDFVQELAKQFSMLPEPVAVK